MAVFELLFMWLVAHQTPMRKQLSKVNFNILFSVHTILSSNTNRLKRPKAVILVEKYQICTPKASSGRHLQSKYRPEGALECYRHYLFTKITPL